MSAKLGISTGSSLTVASAIAAHDMTPWTNCERSTLT